MHMEGLTQEKMAKMFFNYLKVLDSEPIENEDDVFGRVIFITYA